jgi:hypothetical protein
MGDDSYNVSRLPGAKGIHFLRNILSPRDALPDLGIHCGMIADKKIHLEA